MAYINKSKNDNWQTPPQLYNELDQEFNFDFDPCPPNPKYDGLLMGEWGNSNFVNPPYSQLKDWLKKCFEQWKKGKTVVVLMPSRTDTQYWHDYCMKATEIRFLKGRLKFVGAKSPAPFPSVIIVFRGHQWI